MPNKLDKARQQVLALIDGFLPSIKAPLQDNINIIYHAAVNAKKPAHEAGDKDKTIHEQREQVDRLQRRVQVLQSGSDLIAAQATIRAQADELRQTNRQLARRNADNNTLRRELQEAKANAKPKTVLDALNHLLSLVEPTDSPSHKELFHCLCALACGYTTVLTDLEVNDDYPAFVRSVTTHMSRAIKAIADDWR